MEVLEVHQPQQQPNAGTKPLAFTDDNRYVVKIGSEREEFTYKYRQDLGLDESLVGSVRDAEPVYGLSNLIEGVFIDDRFHKLTKAIRQPDRSIGERLIVTRRLGEGKSNNAFTMDIKIGYHTKSGEQFELEGKGWWSRQGKKVEHNLKDLPFLFKMGPIFHGSGWRGFDVDPKGARAFHEHEDEKNFPQCLKKILDDIESMWKRLRNASMVFVGSSLFCFFDLDNPANSSAKILDPDHPILLQSIDVEQYPPTLMRENALKEQQEANFVFSRDWNEYQKKYVDSFLEGLILIHIALENKSI